MFPFGISVIICTFNGGNRLQLTLEALNMQSIEPGTPCEIIVVNNASTDNTVQLVEDYWGKAKSKIPLTIISEPNPGKANALLRGYNHAKYELMLLCDDDNWLQPDYLKTVFEIYREHPEIGLLGGYGKAIFDPGEEPEWFTKWGNCYACGKHHTRNGFLSKSDLSIWGAGSVLRKTMWVFLRQKGFSFYNSTAPGKALSEDAELSVAITFTGHQLYFDERLWFRHDLRGGRISWENLIQQQSVNGKTNAILYMYQIAYDLKKPTKQLVTIRYIGKILRLSFNLLKSFLRPFNKPRWIFFFHLIKELLTYRQKYIQNALKSSQWVEGIKNAQPLYRTIVK